MKFYDYLFDLFSYICYMTLGIILSLFTISGTVYLAIVLPIIKKIIIIIVGFGGFVYVYVLEFLATRRKHKENRVRLLWCDDEKIQTVDKEVVIFYDDIEKIISIGPEGYRLYEVVIFSKDGDIISFMNFRAIEYLLKRKNANLQHKLAYRDYDSESLNRQYQTRKAPVPDVKRKYFR